MLVNEFHRSAKRRSYACRDMLPYRLAFVRACLDAPSHHAKHFIAWEAIFSHTSLRAISLTFFGASFHIERCQPDKDPNNATYSEGSNHKKDRPPVE